MVIIMEEKNTSKRLLEYNSIIKENDELYHKVSTALGLPDCAFWILYILREDNKVLTQSEICSALYQPKQTVNSSLKKLEYDGYIELIMMKDRRSKEIHLTQKGKVLAQNTVDKVICAEQNALSGLTAEEQDTFIGLFRKYTDLLKSTMLTWNKK